VRRLRFSSTGLLAKSSPAWDRHETGRRLYVVRAYVRTSECCGNGRGRLRIETSLALIRDRLLVLLLAFLFYATRTVMARDRRMKTRNRTMFSRRLI